MQIIPYITTIITAVSVVAYITTSKLPEPKDIDAVDHMRKVGLKLFISLAQSDIQFNTLEGIALPFFEKVGCKYDYYRRYLEFRKKYIYRDVLPAALIVVIICLVCGLSEFFVQAQLNIILALLPTLSIFIFILFCVAGYLNLLKIYKHYNETNNICENYYRQLILLYETRYGGSTGID